MKKILFLILICLIKLNAYEFLFLYRISSFELPSSTRYLYYIDDSGLLKVKQIYNNGKERIYNANSYIYLNHIKYGTSFDNTIEFISNEEFMSYFKNNNEFLNDFYTQYINQILNYFYNDNTFSNENYIIYDNYQILYNSDGLAVESIVNGQWAGLYDGPDHSGYLYDEKGDLKYINGVPPSFFESSFNKLMRRFGINLQSIFIRKIFYPLLVLIFACVVFRSVIRMAFKAFLIRFYDKKIGQLEKRREKIENA